MKSIPLRLISLSFLFIAFTGCHVSPYPSSPEERISEFDQLWKGVNEYWKTPLGYSNPDKPPQVQRLMAMACSDPSLYDRLLELACPLNWYTRSLLFLKESPPSWTCSLGEDYSLVLISRLSAECRADRRSALLLSLWAHSRHRHAQKGVSEPYDSSIPGRLADMLSRLTPSERSNATAVQCSYYVRFPEVRAALWERVRDAAEDVNVRKTVTAELIGLAVSGSPDLQREITIGLCSFLTEAKDSDEPEVAGDLARYRVEYHVPRMAPENREHFESALARVAAGARQVSYRLDAIQGLSMIRSHHVAKLVDQLLGTEPSGQIFEKAVYSIVPDEVVYEVASKTHLPDFRKALLHRYALFPHQGDQCETAIKRFLSLLKDDPDEGVRETGLYGLVREIEAGIRRSYLDAGHAFAYAGEALDAVIRDTSVHVRRSAIQYLKENVQFVGFLDSETCSKIEKLAASVPSEGP